jgi:NAD(P)-dependent dehydrogenase (short-subunit alcohol dehydrogenase family)
MYRYTRSAAIGRHYSSSIHHQLTNSITQYIPRLLAHDEGTCRNDRERGYRVKITTFHLRIKVSSYHFTNNSNRSNKDQYGCPSSPQSRNPLQCEGISRCYYWRRQRYVFLTLKATPLPHLQPYANTQVPKDKDLQILVVGLGLAIASALYQNNASKIYLLGRRSGTLEAGIKTLESSPSAPKTSTSVLSAISCDVTSKSSIDAAVAQITKETGYVDVLINNAGVTGPANGSALYEATSIEHLRDTMLKDWEGWENCMAINTQSVVGVSAAFLPLLEAANTRRGWAKGKVEGTGNPRNQDKSVLEGLNVDGDDDRLSHIITVASVASFMRQSTAGLAYNASKAGAAQLGKILASVFAPWGIRSNVVCPGPYPSEMTTQFDGRYGTNQIPQGRMGNINDIAAVALFLIGKGGAYVNGTVQVTDGGRLSVLPSTY